MPCMSHFRLFHLFKGQLKHACRTCSSDYLPARAFTHLLQLYAKLLNNFFATKSFTGRAATVLSKTTLEKDADNLLPDDVHYTVQDMMRLFCRPKWTVSCGCCCYLMLLFMFYDIVYLDADSGKALACIPFDQQSHALILTTSLSVFA